MEPQTLRDVYDRHLKAVYRATRADIELKEKAEATKAELDAQAGAVRALIAEATKAQIEYEKALLHACEELKAPIGHSIDVFGDGKVKPQAECLNPDGTPRGKSQSQ
jgi:hypothetical protein